MAVNILIYPEAVVHSCSVKKMFFKILETSTCAGVFSNKVAGLRPPSNNSLKKKTAALVFSCGFCKIFKNTYFVEHLRTLHLHISEIFMTTNFSFWNYDVINFFNTWIKSICIEKLAHIEFTPYFFLYFLSYLVTCMFLLACIDSYLFI